jgi:hypothetical protein
MLADAEDDWMLSAVFGVPRIPVEAFQSIHPLVAETLHAQITVAPSRIDTTAAVAALFVRMMSVT